jgi:1,4-alpha-glucan branching enzyme
LLYRGLAEFDRAMMSLDAEYRLLSDPLIEQLALHADTKQLVYRRGPLVFAFNFHPHESQTGLRIPVPDQRDYRLVLNSDAHRFSGPGLVDEKSTYPWQKVPMYERQQSVQVYLPARTALVLAPS